MIGRFNHVAKAVSQFVGKKQTHDNVPLRLLVASIFPNSLLNNFGVCALLNSHLCLTTKPFYHQFLDNYKKSE